MIPTNLVGNVEVVGAVELHALTGANLYAAVDGHELVPDEEEGTTW